MHLVAYSYKGIHITSPEYPAVCSIQIIMYMKFVFKNLLWISTIFYCILMIVCNIANKLFV